LIEENIISNDKIDNGDSITDNINLENLDLKKEGSKNNLNDNCNITHHDDIFKTTKQIKNKQHDYPFELSKDEGVNGKIFRTSNVDEKKKNQVNFKIIKNKHKLGGQTENKKFINNSFDNSNNGSSVFEEIDEHEEERKKELEKMLDNFMSNKRRRKSFTKENYLDILLGIL
jgi:hypothetical protein